MTDPVHIVVAAGILILAAAVFLLPRHGVLARMKRVHKDARRVMIEDALKHLHDCDYNKIACTVPSIAGALMISLDDAAALTSRLSAMGLLVPTDTGVKLTPEGNSYALRVVRVHRLWEKYLADETSLPQTEWHSSAEDREHRISPAEAEALAAQLGNPLFDPHGDPIPTAAGEIPPKKGAPLSSVAPGEWAVITHIEDEPKALFAQLSAEGLYVGMRIKMIEHTNLRIRFAADGEEIVLAPVIANNLSVELLPHAETVPASPMATLASVTVGEAVTVVGISKALRGQQRRRLLDLGVVPGTLVRAEMRSVSGDPTAYTIRGALVALRNEHAQMIFIERGERVSA